METMISKSDLLSTPLSVTDFSTLQRRASSYDLETNGKTVCLICMPNAGLYEYISLDQNKLVEILLVSGVYVLLWNYRSYGESKGTVNLDV